MSTSRSLTAAVLLALVACGARAADIQATDPWVRAVPPTQPNTAIFMTLENRSGAERALVDARSPASAVVELHTHVQDAGIMRMRRVDRIVLPAGGPTQLAPGGLHIMLIGLAAPLEPQQQVPLVLTFDDGSELAVRAPVRSAPAMPVMHMNQH